MTLTHIDFAVVQRSKFRNGKPGCAVKTAAYLMCGPLEKDDGTAYDFSRKKELVHTEILLPDGAPQRFRDPKILWNACENVERRSDSQTARQVLLTIPRECPEHLRVGLARAVAERWRAAGMGVQYAVHNPASSADKEEQPHIHFQLTMRAIEDTESGLSPRKRMDWNTQFFGPSRGRDERKRICADANTFFARRDLQIRLDPRTLSEQGIDRPSEPDAPRAAWESWKRQGADPEQAPAPVAAVLQHRELRRDLLKSLRAADHAAIEVAHLEARIAITMRNASLIMDAASGTASTSKTPQENIIMRKPTQTKKPAAAAKAAAEPWMRRSGGYDALSDALQRSAKNSYEKWASANPDLGRRHDLDDYCAYVQEQQSKNIPSVDNDDDDDDEADRVQGDGIAPANKKQADDRRARHLEAILAERYMAPAMLRPHIHSIEVDRGGRRAVLHTARGGRLLDYGDRIEHEGSMTPDLAAAIAAAAHGHGWTSVVLTGSPAYRDAVAISCALNEPPVATNHPLDKANAATVAGVIQSRAVASVAPAVVSSSASPAEAARTRLDHADAVITARLSGRPQGITDADELAAPRITQLIGKRDTALEDAREASAAAAGHRAAHGWTSRLLDGASRRRQGLLDGEARRMDAHARTLDRGHDKAVKRLERAATGEAKANAGLHEDWKWSPTVRRALAEQAQIQAARKGVEGGDEAVIAAINSGNIPEGARMVDVRGAAMRHLLDNERGAGINPERLGAARLLTAAAVNGSSAVIDAASKGDLTTAATAAQEWKREQDERATEARRVQRQALELAARRDVTEPVGYTA
jgi:hypothetical protein